MVLSCVFLLGVWGTSQSRPTDGSERLGPTLSGKLHPAVSMTSSLLLCYYLSGFSLTVTVVCVSIYLFACFLFFVFQDLKVKCETSNNFVSFYVVVRVSHLTTIDRVGPTNSLFFRRYWALKPWASFIHPFFILYRTPLAMAVWSLSCFFVSASTNKWIRALYPDNRQNKNSPSISYVNLWFSFSFTWTGRKAATCKSKSIYVFGWFVGWFCQHLRLWSWLTSLWLCSCPCLCLCLPVLVPITVCLSVLNLYFVFLCHSLCVCLVSLCPVFFICLSVCFMCVCNFCLSLSYVCP